MTLFYQRELNVLFNDRRTNARTTGIGNSPYVRSQFIIFTQNTGAMLTTVKGTYGHGQIILHEIPSIQEGTQVLVTFLENETREEPQKASLQNKKGVRFGSLAGKVSIPDNFNEPLDDLNEYM